jgi:hypothetical protein
MTQENKEQLLLQIPVITNDKVKLFVDNKFVGWCDVNQVNQYRYNVIKYIKETGDTSVRDRFYFVGHLDNNTNEPGNEIKMELEDNFGNFSSYPYELAHIRRQIYNLMKLTKDLPDELRSIS